MMFVIKMKVTRDRPSRKETKDRKVREKVGGRGRPGEKKKRWADEITPAGLLALAAGVEQCDVP